MKKAIIYTLITMLMANTVAFAQNPWTRAKGAGLVQLGANYVGGNNIFTNNGTSVATPYHVNDLHLAMYGDYGITDKLTVMLDLPFKILSNSGGEVQAVIDNYDSFYAGPPPPPPTVGAGNLVGFGNIGVAAKYRIVNANGFVATTQLRTDIPIVAHNFAADLVTGEPTWKFTPSISGGYTGKRVFGAAELGFAYRPYYYNDFLASAQVGVSFLHKRLYLIVPFQYRKGLDGGNSWSVGEYTGLYAPRQSYISTGLTVSAMFGKHIGMSATALVLPFGGNRNVLAAPTFGIGVHYKWGE